ncbi:hypothetical protein MmazTMA_31040 [Methanosarcina mazei]|nr:hypothetical protein MmazTMA_31040 [Methanosarcina mazei]
MVVGVKDWCSIKKIKNIKQILFKSKSKITYIFINISRNFLQINNNIYIE